MTSATGTMSFPTLPGSPVKPSSADLDPFREPAVSDHIFALPTSKAASTESPGMMRQTRHSIASDLSSTTLDSCSSAASHSTGYPVISRPISGSTMASSRPSSVVSNSSSTSFSQVQGQLAACPGLLSPGLASALGLASGQASSSGSSSRTKDHRRPHRRVRAQSSHGSMGATRRPSLPIVSSMNHRMSVASISSFESLPEDDIVRFASACGPGCLPRSRNGSYDRNHEQIRPASSGTSASTSDLSLGPTPFPVVNSPPSSPSKLSRELANVHLQDASGGSQESQASSCLSVSSRPSMLNRSATEPVQTTEFSIMMSRRKLGAMELLDTEQTFVASLRLLDEEYYKPLMASLGRGRNGLASPSTSTATPILSRKSMGEIFSNFSDILHLSQELLFRLEERLAKGQRSAKDELSSFRQWDPALDNIGDILVPLAPFMKMYSLYVKNFSSALQRIETERKTNETFSKFLKETEKRRWSKERAAGGLQGKQSFGFGLGFQAHLLTIVQRIPRYKLLVDDLIKFTPESHPDLVDLAKAGRMIEQVASYINENVRQHEMVLMMLSLQRSLHGLTEPLIVPGRSLIKRGTLMKTCRRNVQPREFFLFTDCIIYASPISGGIESASAAWLALAQRGGLYAGGQADSIFGSGPAIPISPTEPSSTIESVMPPSRLRTISGPEPFTPLAGAIFSLAGHQLQFRSKFMLRDCTVVSTDDHAGNGLRHCFEIRTPEKSFAVYAENSNSKAAWVGVIREARADFMSARRTLKAEEDSIEARRDRRRSQYRLDLSKPSNRRLSLQSLGGALGGAMSPTAHPISEADGEEVDGEGHGADLASARTRTDSLPNLFRPPSFPSLPSSSTSMSLATLLTSSTNATPTRPLRTLEDYNAPVWVPDNRADKCTCCSEQFGMWRRKHHCRLCGQVVCWSCSQRSFLIPSYQEGEEDKPARACDLCYDSVFPPESPEVTPLTLGMLSPGSVDMTSEPSNSESAKSVSSSGRDTSPGSPRTPAGGRSPNLDIEGPSPLGSPQSMATLKMEASEERPRMDRPKSLRFDNLSPAIYPAHEDTVLLGAAMVPPRERSLPGGMLQMPERGTALEAQLFNASLSPQVQAATSGSGTFRLVTPRLTTPESELPPARRGCSHAQNLISASYFAGANIREDAAAEMEANFNTSEPFRPSMIHGPNGIPAHLRPQKKRPMSAAARLSTFYAADVKKK